MKSVLKIIHLRNLKGFQRDEVDQMSSKVKMVKIRSYFISHSYCLIISRKILENNFILKIQTLLAINFKGVNCLQFSWCYLAKHGEQVQEILKRQGASAVLRENLADTLTERVLLIKGSIRK